MIQSPQRLKGVPRLTVRFFRESTGSEPVRDWLKGLPKAEKREIGADIKTVQFGWPIGMPLVDHIDGGIWEVRTRLATRLASLDISRSDHCAGWRAIFGRVGRRNERLR